MTTVLYLLRHKNINEYVKIGYTTNLEKRIKSLQTSSPTGIEVIHTIPTKYARQLEQYFHRKYKHKNTNLEWFKLDREDILDIIFKADEMLANKKEN